MKFVTTKRSAIAILGVAVGAVAILASTQGEALARGGFRSGQGGRYTNADFRGRYGVLETGIIQGDTWNELALMHSDGDGNTRIEVVANLGGHTRIVGTATCTYDVQPNGFLTMECVNDGNGQEIGVDGILVDNARELRFITQPSEHGQAQGTARLQ